MVGSDQEYVPRMGTTKLGDGVPLEDTGVHPDVTYRPVPHTDTGGKAALRPVWRLRFDLMTEPRGSFGLDVNGEVTLGRGTDGNEIVDLTPYDAEKLGVSRRHVLLRPTATKLFLLDVGSTNGTLWNDRPIGVNTPFSLSSGDVLTLGRLQCVVSIVDRPSGETGILRAKADLGDALTEMVKAIASQLELDEILSQAVDAAISLASASETAVWLKDPATEELFLEAEQGIGDDAMRRNRLPVTDALVSQVIETGEPLRVNRKPGGGQVGFKTASLVESLVYVPIGLGGVTFGVLAAAHRESGREFTERDQRILGTIADFAAIAVQNSRTYQATEKALARRVEELAAVNELSRAVSASLDPMKVYNVLTQRVQKHWAIHRVSLWMVDESKKVTLVSDSHSDSNGSDEPISRTTRRIIDRVAESGEPLLISDMQPEVNGITMEDTQEMRSEVAVPIKLQQRVLGVLDLQSPDLNRFSETDILALQTVADQLAIAIQNALLYRQVQRHAQKLEQHVERRTEDLNSANEHLQALAILKDEFVSNVSHELRTPITSLKLLQNVLRTAPAGKRERYLDAMQRETDRLERIVNDLLRLSRMDQGQVALNPMRLDLNALVHQFVTDRGPLAESRGLTLLQTLKSELPPVMADQGLLGQTMSILLTNALNYTPAGGEVRVSTVVQQVGDDTWVGFSISDTGPGISTEEQPHLFERFFRGQAGRESGSSGAGLGLAIVKEIVDLHDGRVEVESDGIPGEGTTFTIWLPTAGIREAHLLLVDDNATMLEVIEQILSSSGYDVVAASSGEEALTAIHNAEGKGALPEVIISDVVMGGMTGLKLLEIVRANPVWADIPFLFMSASTTLAMEGQIAGMDNVAFLRKPFDSETLQRLVANILNERAEINAAGGKQ